MNLSCEITYLIPYLLLQGEQIRDDSASGADMAL